MGFFGFFFIGVHSEIFFENLGLLICPTPYGNETLKKSANLLWQYLLKRKTYKNTVSKYRFACCKPNPNYRKNVSLLHSDTAVETALDIQCQIKLKNMQNIFLLWVSFLMFVLMQSMTLLGKYSAGNYNTFLTCFTVCSLNGLCSVHEINKNFHHYSKSKPAVSACASVV